MAASSIIPAFKDLRTNGLIDDLEWLRIAYRFASETVDLKDVLEDGKKAPPLQEVARQQQAAEQKAAQDTTNKIPGNSPAKPDKSKVNIDNTTGDVTIKGENK